MIQEEELRNQIIGNLPNITGSSIINNIKPRSSGESGGILPVTTSVVVPAKVCQKPGLNGLEEKHWGPFRKLPNVRKFRVIVKDYDPLFKRFGITKRLPVELKYEPHANNKYNRYLNHQFRRMSFVDSVTY